MTASASSAARRSKLSTSGNSAVSYLGLVDAVPLAGKRPGNDPLTPHLPVSGERHEWRLPHDTDPHRLLDDVLGFLLDALTIALSEDMPQPAGSSFTRRLRSSAIWWRPIHAPRTAEVVGRTSGLDRLSRGRRRRPRLADAQHCRLARMGFSRDQSCDRLCYISLHFGY
jgi:hypothetical protein